MTQSASIKVSTSTLILLIAIHFSFWVSAQGKVDLILYNGEIVTVDENFSIVEAIAITGEKIAAVGSTSSIRKLAGPETLEINLKGRTVIPGLINTHTHPHFAAEGNYGNELGAPGLRQYPLNWKAIRSKEDFLQQIDETFRKYSFQPGEWVYFSDSEALSIENIRLLWTELTRWDLDTVSRDHPVVVNLGFPSTVGNLVNSKAVKILWEKYGRFIEKYGRYWLDSSGKPDGHLGPPASRLPHLLLPLPPAEQLAGIYKKSIEELNAVGITTISTRLPEYSVRVFRHLENKGNLSLRIGYALQQAFDDPEWKDWKNVKMGQGSEHLWVSALTVSLTDGASFGSCTDLRRVSVNAPQGPALGNIGMGAGNPMSEWFPRGWCYLDREFNGAPRGNGAPLAANYFQEWYEKVAEAGLRSANAHVDGDATHRMLLTMFERIHAGKPGSVSGWSMDHCTWINPQDIPRAARLNVMWSCSPSFANAENTARILGEPVVHAFLHPVKSLVRAGINVSLEEHQDQAQTLVDRATGENEHRTFWHSLELLITRKDARGKVWGAQERVDRMTALRIATINGARYVLKEKQLGSLEPGKLADLLILDRDYLFIPEDEISNLQPLLTVVGGSMVFVHSRFAMETGLNPPGALISTFTDLVKRRRPFPNSRS
ncbi:MAG: amidohydrolase family protein [Acidobacteria bacterium]|nr:amidohydrolase family protein [Acidobacteriota bacterium]